jgi:hypothetical protein
MLAAGAAAANNGATPRASPALEHRRFQVTIGRIPKEDEVI